MLQQATTQVMPTTTALKGLTQANEDTQRPNNYRCGPPEI